MERAWRLAPRFWHYPTQRSPLLSQESQLHETTLTVSSFCFPLVSSRLNFLRTFRPRLGRRFEFYKYFPYWNSRQRNSTPTRLNFAKFLTCFRDSPGADNYPHKKLRLFSDLQKFKGAEHRFRARIRVFGGGRNGIVFLGADQKDMVCLGVERDGARAINGFDGCDQTDFV